MAYILKDYNETPLPTKIIEEDENEIDKMENWSYDIDE